jgi:arylsulfatase A-like enzyme
MTNPAIDVGNGFGQGFDDFASPPGLERAGPGMLEGEPLVADVERVLESLDGRPVFLWLHFMDTHGPYFPPETYRRRFPPDDYRWAADPPALPIGAGNFGLDLIPRYQAVAEERSPAVYRASYDAEVRYVDDHVATVVRALERHGLWNETLFLFTADHGESLGEHGYYFAHGWFVYDDQIRVPLVLRGPGVPAGRRIRQSVSLVDLAPTILDLLGLPASATMEGRTLRPFLEGSPPDREAFAQSYYGEGLVAYRTGGMKYVFKPPRTSPRAASDPPFPDAAQEWLFDVDRDPGETSNLVPARQDALATMRSRVQAWLDDQSKRGQGRTAENPRGGKAPVRVLGDPQLERQLRALGYLD